MLHLAPKAETQRGFLGRFLQTFGLGATAAILFVVAASTFFASHFLFTTPEGLYHRVYQAVPIFLYEPNANPNWSSWQSWEHKYDGKIKSDADAVKYANEMIGSLNDPFTHLYSAEETRAMKQQMSGQFSGIGIGLDVQMDPSGEKPLLSSDGKPMPKADADGYPLVDRVFEGGPSDSAGLKAGDALVSADGIDFKDKSLDVVVTALKNGKSGTTVKLIVRRDGADHPVDVVRGVINSPAVTVKTFGKTGYIRLESFEQDDTVEEMKAALKSLSGSESLVIDLRGNPGGRVDICIDLVSLFLKEGTVVSIRNRVPYQGYSKTTHSLTAGDMVEEELDEGSGAVTRSIGPREAYMAGGKPIVILVNGHSASASEMFTGALKDNGVAVVIGEQTFGKGIGQMIIPFPNGTMLGVTTLRYFTPNGTWVGDGSSQHHGIKPDHEVKQATKVLRPGSDTDNQLQFALELLESGK